MSEKRIPSEKQIESTMEVLAWLKARIPDYSVDQVAVKEFEGILKWEVKKCLEE